MSRWAISFEAIDPKNTVRKWDVGLKFTKISLLQKRGHSVKLARCKLVEEVMACTNVLIQGWSRPEYNEEYLVYVGSPKYDKRKLGDVEDGDIENPAPKGKLFLVFVLPDGTIEDWAWRDADPDNPSLPSDCKKGKVVWKRK